jgi:hypothetical protein
VGEAISNTWFHKVVKVPEAAEKAKRSLVDDISEFCAAQGIAETTFGRLAANDGKLVGRIRAGSGITAATTGRVRAFMADVEMGRLHVQGRPLRKHDVSNAAAMAELIETETGLRTPGSFAFHEQRQRYLVFASTTNEATVLADRASLDLASIPIEQPGARLFFSPMENGAAINRVLRAFHHRHPTVPVLVVIKGRSLEEVHSTMGHLVDRLIEHPMTVLVLTNMYIREAVRLQKLSDDCPHPVSWRDVALVGRHAQEFETQLAPLYPELAREWLVHQGDYGQPVYEKPSVLVLYRKDHQFLVENLIPRQGESGALRFHYSLLNHPYLHSHTMRFRIDYVLLPVLNQLAHGGSVTIVQSAGGDPAHDIVWRVWPSSPVHFVRRQDVMAELRRALGANARNYTMHGLTDTGALFRFDMHTLPPNGLGLGASALMSAWNNAVYFAQISEESVQARLNSGNDHIEATRAVIEENGGLWFLDEALTIYHRKDAP